MSLSFVNQKQERLSIHLDPENQQMSIDRSASGLVDFQEDFKTIQTGPIGDLPPKDIPVAIFLDHSSVEIFLNNGQKVMTAQFFNSLPFHQLKIENNAAETHVYSGLKITPIQGIWDAE
jgi:fructan beta-fructosidase